MVIYFLIQAIPRRAVKARTVQALQSRNWVCDIKGALTVQVMMEYLLVWDLVDSLILHWCPWSGSLEANPIRGLQQQISLCRILRWNHQVHPLEENLEELGPFALQILLVVGFQQQMLDCRLASQAGIASSNCLPVLWPSWGNNPAFARLMCFLSAGLVFLFTMTKSGCCSTCVRDKFL